MDDIDRFHQLIGSAPSISPSGKPQYCPLNEAFWACSGAFSIKSQSHKQNDFRRIWLFTNDDNPNGFDSDLQSKAVQAARDCAESRIELSLWHMNKAKKNFLPDKFYTKLLAIGDDDASTIDLRMKGAGYDGFDTMMASVRRKEHKKRRMGSLMLTLGQGQGEGSTATVEIALQMYKTINISKRPTHTWLYKRSHEPLKVGREWI